MRKTPSGLRLHIGLFGRTNVGKSSFLNMIAGQEVAITSPLAGTTTDIVVKPMELLPIGPVKFLDTAGLDDETELGEKRIQKTRRALDRTDIAVLVLEPNKWTRFEEEMIREARLRGIPVIGVVNKIDLEMPSQKFLGDIREYFQELILCSTKQSDKREEYINAFKRALQRVLPKDVVNPPTLIGDLLPPGGLAVLIVPIDLQAPKGRLILPQVQAIRDALDNDAAVVVVKEREYPALLRKLSVKPDLVVCDSQVVLKMIADTPSDVKATTFSILFARFKGDLIEAARNVAEIERLKPGDKVLIAEACSHHPLQDDIGRVKIPRWLRQYVGLDLKIDVYAGKDFPENLEEYKLVIHCGGCMLNRREMLSRIRYSKLYGVPITNYGLTISFLHGVIERVLSPFPAALDAYKRRLEEIKGKRAPVSREIKREPIAIYMG